MVHVDDLVNRSKLGTVTPAEQAEVAAILAAGDGGENKYALLYVLGRSEAFRYENLVADFLEHRDDPMLARLALQILTDFWGRTDKYQAQLERFLNGVDWDPGNDVRDMAITTAGRYLKTTEHSGLLNGLIRVVSAPPVLDEDGIDNDEFSRGLAFTALAEALGEPARAARSDAAGLLERARQRAVRTGSSPAPRRPRG